MDIDGLHYFAAGQIDDRDGAIVRVRRPDFLAVGRNVKALGALAYRDCGLNPAGNVSALLTIENADAVGIYIGSTDSGFILRHYQHMSAVLAKTEDPIDLP